MNTAHTTQFPARRSSAPTLPAAVREAAQERYYAREASGETPGVLRTIHTALLAVNIPTRFTLAEVKIATRFVEDFAEGEATWGLLEDTAQAFHLDLYA